MTESASEESWQFLSGEVGQTHLATLRARPLEELRGVRVVSELRASGLESNQVSALLAQALLQKKAMTKFGADAERMLFTQSGLEQATRAIVAKSHATRFVNQGMHSVADLGCGIGAESRALAAAGLDVTAVDLDPQTAVVAAFNLSSYPQATIEIADAEAFDATRTQALFFDPARRTSGLKNTKRLTDTAEYSPSLNFVFEMAKQKPTALKLGPGFDHELIPSEAEAQYTSVDGEAVETLLWFGALTDAPGARRATVFRGSAEHTLSEQGSPVDEPMRALGEYIHEPDPAIIRARLIGSLARTLSAGMVNEKIAYLTSDHESETPFARTFRVRELLPASEDRLKKALRERKIGTLEIKKRGMDLDPAQLRKRLQLRGEHSATLILTRIGQERCAILTDRV